MRFFKAASCRQFLLALAPLVLLIPILVLADAITLTERTVDGSYLGASHAVGIDFDSDGDKDLVTIAYQDGDVSWYRNNGSQSFTEVTIDGSLGAPIKLQVVDLDDDGDLDVAVADYGSDDLIWYENNGSMSFAAKQTIDSTIDGILDFHAVDLSGDGNDDLVATGRDDNTFAWYKNDGSESFTQIAIDSTLSCPYNVHTGDLDGDSDTDIISHSTCDSDVFWYQNSGTGSFTKVTIDTSVTNPRGIHIADIDDDGDKDFVISAAGVSDVLWFRNSGTGSFTRFTIDSNIAGAHGVHVADLDGDGDQDVLSTAQSDQDLIWYDNDGSETFTERTIDSAAGYPYWVSTADIDSDGDADVVSTDYNGGDVMWYEQAGTGYPDATAYSPTDNATGVSTTANLVITFDKATRAGTGTLTIKKSSDSSTVETITVSGALLSGNGSTQLTLNPSTTLSESTAYYVNWTGNAFKDTSGGHTTALSSTTTWSFTTGDFTAPATSGLSPADDATGVSPTANLVLTFDQVTRAGTGSLTIKRASDNSTVNTITTSGSTLSGNGSTELTFNPAVTLSGSTSYYINWTANAFKDTSMNHTTVLTSTSTWNFTTHETTAPTASSLSPADGATDVAVSANLIITFDEAVQGGSGTIILKKTSDDSILETISATGALVTGSGSTTITINPSTTLSDNTGYYVTVHGNAFRDSVRNYFAGISTSTTWNFQTAAAATPAAENTEESSGGGGGGGGSRSTTVRSIASALERRNESVPSVPAISPHETGRKDSPVDAAAQMPSDARVFQDVRPDDWFTPYIQTLHAAGIIEGYEDAQGQPTGLYGPSDPVTYGELAKMILLLSDLSGPETTDGADWALPYMAKAKGAGLTVYMTPKLAQEPATRGEVIRTALETYGIQVDGNPVHIFADLPDNHPATDAILDAWTLGIISGDGVPTDAPRTVRPDDAVNRSEIAKILSILKENFSPEPLIASPDALPDVTINLDTNAGQNKRYVGASTLNLRTDSRINATILDVLHQGAPLELLDIAHDNWAHVRLENGLEGYVWRDHLTR